ncbi:hypothetical protein [Sphingobacterium yanglingense]|uniref:Uncharacterized protein n=1 Tax=Sphingobacterium yanglingense TaxID=1437280 RepID=A0A4R6WNQ9_9SPHI|nr:hypothetical protein [Sphingobacterium yanglingense]TDQ79761.1 hypothetical protein CLV99_1209 [Sphingobacterium yanglingense]
MNKITVTNLVDFGRKTPKGRQTLINNLKVPKISNPDDGGGDYWISALSCLARAFTDNSKNLIGDKIEELIDKIEDAKAKISKDMFQRNINILQEFEDFDFNTLKPQGKLSALKKPKDKSIVVIKRLPLFVKPHHVYSFEENGIKKIGAIWFVAKLNGFRTDELSMVTDLLYRYLDINYSDEFEVSVEYCIAVDVNTPSYIPYSRIENGDIKSALIPTVDEMKKLM